MQFRFIRATLFFVASLLCFASSGYAQTPDSLTAIPPGSQVRLFDSADRIAGQWVGLRDSVVVLHNSGIRRLVPVAKIDSAQVFRAESRRGMLRGAIAGGLVGAASFYWLGRQLCDTDPCNDMAKFTIAGAGLGSIAGVVIGGVVGAATGRWLLVYRRPTGQR